MKINPNFAIAILARRRAILTVKARAKAKGERVSLVRMPTWHVQAQAELAANADYYYALAKAEYEAIQNEDNRKRNSVVAAAAVRSQAELKTEVPENSGHLLNETHAQKDGENDLRLCPRIDGQSNSRKPTIDACCGGL